MCSRRGAEVMTDNDLMMDCFGSMECVWMEETIFS